MRIILLQCADGCTRKVREILVLEEFQYRIPYPVASQNQISAAEMSRAKALHLIKILPKKKKRFGSLPTSVCSERLSVKMNKVFGTADWVEMTVRVPSRSLTRRNSH
jgi:hypothetical protein